MGYVFHPHPSHPAPLLLYFLTCMCQIFLQHFITNYILSSWMCHLILCNHNRWSACELNLSTTQHFAEINTVQNHAAYRCTQLLPPFDFFHVCKYLSVTFFLVHSISLFLFSPQIWFQKWRPELFWWEKLAEMKLWSKPFRYIMSLLILRVCYGLLAS